MDEGLRRITTLPAYPAVVRHAARRERNPRARRNMNRMTGMPGFVPPGPNPAAGSCHRAAPVSDSPAQAFHP